MRILMQNLNVSCRTLNVALCLVLTMTSCNSKQNRRLDTTVASPLTEAPAIWDWQVTHM
jgi:hypothetical protein